MNRVAGRPTGFGPEVAVQPDCCGPDTASDIDRGEFVMRASVWRFLIPALVASVLAIGCGGTKVQQQNTTTMGQELMDLKESHDRGIITDEEYRKAKKEIMRRYE